MRSNKMNPDHIKCVKDAKLESYFAIAQMTKSMMNLISNNLMYVVSSTLHLINVNKVSWVALTCVVLAVFVQEVAVAMAVGVDVKGTTI
jgi:hypothetical protein